jgi:hypothetical protein
MTGDSGQNATTWTVRDLRRRWKPTKEQLAGDPAHEPFLIRIHRACSWLQRVEQLQAGDGALDAILIFQWIALNSLYGRWDPDARQPLSDRDTLPAFLDRVLALDADGRITDILEEHRRLVMSIFDDGYLTAFFWEEPSAQRARKTQKTKFDAQTWYHEERYRLILDRLMERIYFLRCQLVHGGATFGGRLNRTAVRRCSTMLGHMIPAILLVLIDYGYEQNWGPLCYPPQP